MQDIKTELRLGSRLKLERAVACTNGNGKRIHTRLADELFHFVWLCIGGILSRYVYIILDACQLTQFCFYYCAAGVGILYYFLCNLNILLKRILGSINHNGGETAVYTGLADLKVCTVIQMQGNRNIGILNDRSLNKLGQIRVICILPGSCRHLQNNRRIQLAGRFRNRLYDLHVVHIESADCIAALIGLLEHFSCCN